MVQNGGAVIGPCTMVDVSAGGARLKFGAQVEVPDEFILLLSCFDGSLMRRCFVAWREEKEIGVQFRGA
jgi:hypothetical protein